MAHDWETDLNRSKLDINLLVWRCRTCGCLQIKNGGPDAPSVYKPNDPTWSPFKTMNEEPPCQPSTRQGKRSARETATPCSPNP